MVLRTRGVAVIAKGKTSAFVPLSQDLKRRAAHLVNVLVEGTVVEQSVRPVMPGVLDEEEDGDLEGDLLPGGEGDFERLHADGGGHGVEEVDLCNDFHGGRRGSASLCKWVEKEGMRAPAATRRRSAT